MFVHRLPVIKGESWITVAIVQIKVATRADDVILFVDFANVEHFFFVGELLPDGHGEAFKAVLWMQDAMVALLAKVGLDNALKSKA